MATYKKFLVKQQSYNGTSYTDVSSVIDIYGTYGIVCQEFPFKYLPETKELAKRDWPDESGEDTFFPTDGLKFNAYDLEAKFIYSGDQKTMQSKILSFIKFITCKDKDGAQCISVYDEYTGMGSRGVYVKEIPNELYDYSDISLNAIAVFKVKFRITDPITRVDNNLNVINE